MSHLNKGGFPIFRVFDVHGTVSVPLGIYIYKELMIIINCTTGPKRELCSAKFFRIDSAPL